MDSHKTMNTLRLILTDLGIPENLVSKDSLLHKDLQLDSTEIVEVSLALKRKLGVNVKLETRQDKTMSEICNMVEAAMSVVEEA